MNELVSVIIPTYKRPDTLSRAIDSVLAQTYRPLEVIVVDDNDPDTEGRRLTEELMGKYESNPFVKYIRHEHNKNGSAARNTGARNAKGAFLAFLDDDDEYLPCKLEAQIKRLRELDDSWGICYCRYYRKTNSGKLVSRSTEKREGYVWFDELCRNFWHGGGTGPVVRRAVFEEIGGFDESFHRNQDYEYMIRITKKYKLAFADVFGSNNYIDSYREHKRTYEEIERNFRDSFVDVIESLDKDHRTKFETMLALQRFRHYLFVERNSQKGLNELKKYHVGFITTARYCNYLLYRRLFKVSCGFQL